MSSQDYPDAKKLAELLALPYSVETQSKIAKLLNKGNGLVRSVDAVRPSSFLPHELFKFFSSIILNIQPHDLMLSMMSSPPNNGHSYGGRDCCTPALIGAVHNA
jgi:hypothetical protein